MDENKPNDSGDTPQPPVEDQGPPAQVPKPPEDTGHVDEQAATDSRPSAPREETSSPPSPPGHSKPGEPAPTVAELDKSHEKDLDEPAHEPKVEKKMADAKGNTSKKGSSALLAVVIALLVTLLLVGIGYAAWQASKSSEANGQNTEESNPPADESIDTSDAEQIDQDLQQIENELDQLESDLDESNLEDEGIGL
ncbi:MAG TPA: hypothetical protein VF996_00985 [Candidatus Saccharimonadales bacterium]|jgi:uncharacterized protein HemX